MYYNIDFGSHELLSVILTLTMPSIGFHECLCIKDIPCNRILRLSENRIVLKHIFYTKKRKYYGKFGQILGSMLLSKSNAEKK